MKNVEVIDVNGIEVVFIKTTKYKTVSLNIFLKDKIDYENNTKLILLSSLLRNACKKYPSVKDMSSYLNDLYDTKLSSTAGVVGETSFFTITAQALNSKFINGNLNINEKLFEIVSEILYSPLLDGKKFKETFFNEHKRIYKEKLEYLDDYKGHVVNKKVDEALGKKTPFGIFSKGDLDDFDKLTPKSLYEEYLKLFKRKMTIYVIGDLKKEEIVEYIKKYFNYFLVETKTNIIYKGEISVKENLVFESSFIQSSFCNVYSIPVYKDSHNYPAAVIYFEILKYYLFKVIREKHNFCYSITPQYSAYLGTLKINSNIEFKNYEQTQVLIKNIFLDLQNKIDKDVFKMAKLKQFNYHTRIHDSLDVFVGLHYYESLIGKKLDLKNYIQALLDVKIEDIKEVAKQVEFKFSLALKERETNE